jgi:hypothetical protein
VLRGRKTGEEHASRQTVVAVQPIEKAKEGNQNREHQNRSTIAAAHALRM